MPYVYSTATCSSKYCDYITKDAKEGSILVKEVEIKGGHGVATPFKDSNFHNVHTPRGVATYVSAEDLAFLKANDGFMEHHKAGFITWDESDKEVKPETRIKDMELRDASAPLTPDHTVPGTNSTPNLVTYKAKK